MRLTELINLADILSLIDFFFFFWPSSLELNEDKKKYSNIVELVCQSFDTIKVATQFFEELKTAVLFYKSCLFRTGSVTLKTIGSLPILFTSSQTFSVYLKRPLSIEKGQ